MKRLRTKLAIILSLLLLAYIPQAIAAQAPADASITDSTMPSLPEEEGYIIMEAETPGGPHGEEHSSGLPQFDTTTFPSQLFWLVIAFSILYLVFSKKTLPQIGEVLQTRSQHIDNNLGEAQKLREQAELEKAQYEAAFNEAQTRSASLYMQAEAEAKARSNTAMEDLRNRSSARLQSVEAEIENAKKGAMDSVHVIAAEIASLAAEKIVGISTDIDQAKTVVRNINKKAA